MKGLSIAVLVIVVITVVNASPRWVKRQAPDAAAPQEPPVPPAEISGGDAPAPSPSVAAAPEQEAPQPASPTAGGAASPTPTQGRQPAPPAGTPSARIAPRPQVPPSGGQQQQQTGLTLADGYADIIGQVRDSFSCEEKIYGYYADVDNGCKVFHVCVPQPADANGAKAPALRFSFFCNNGTIFNQELLVCDYEDNVDCQSATSFYDVNKNFGVIEPGQEGRSAPAAQPQQPPAPAATQSRTRPGAVSPSAPAPSVPAPASPTGSAAPSPSAPAAPAAASDAEPESPATTPAA